MPYSHTTTLKIWITLNLTGNTHLLKSPFELLMDAAYFIFCTFGVGGINGKWKRKSSTKCLCFHCLMCSFYISSLQWIEAQICIFQQVMFSIGVYENLWIVLKHGVWNRDHCLLKNDIYIYLLHFQALHFKLQPFLVFYNVVTSENILVKNIVNSCNFGEKFFFFLRIVSHLNVIPRGMYFINKLTVAYILIPSQTAGRCEVSQQML